MNDVKSEFPIYAHVYNRGVDKRTIFNSDDDRSRFMLTMRIVFLEQAARVSEMLRRRERELIASMQQKKLFEQFGPQIVDILAFCLMPNHYHIVVRSPNKENIAKFAQRLANSYTRYFNTKYNRKGRLFESTYKAVIVETDEQLIHVTRYVHTNPSNSTHLHLSGEQLKSYQWSSLPVYLKGESKMCEIEQVLSFFATPNDFWEFTKAGIKHKENLNPKILIDSN